MVKVENVEAEATYLDYFGARRGVMLRWRRAARLCGVGNFPYDLNYSCRRRTAWAFHADKVSLSVLKRTLSIYLGVDPPDVSERRGRAQTAQFTSVRIRSEAEYPTVEGRKPSVKEDRGFFLFGNQN